jgi:hypothetical protein
MTLYNVSTEKNTTSTASRENINTVWMQCTYYVLLVGPEVFIGSLKKFCNSLMVSVALNPRSCMLLSCTAHWPRDTGVLLFSFIFFHEDST